MNQTLLSNVGCSFLSLLGLSFSLNRSCRLIIKKRKQNKKNTLFVFPKLTQPKDTSSSHICLIYPVVVVVHLLVSTTVFTSVFICPYLCCKYFCLCFCLSPWVIQTSRICLWIRDNSVMSSKALMTCLLCCRKEEAAAPDPMVRWTKREKRYRNGGQD